MLPPQTPPSDLDPNFYILDIQQVLIRIYKNKPDRHALGFNFTGPYGRFDHHRGSLRSPSKDPERGVYYASPVIDSTKITDALSGSIAEVFGDRGDDKTRTMAGMHEKKLCLVETTRKLKLLDLRVDGAMKVGTIAAMPTGNTDRQVTQKWSRYFYENETVFSRIDGIVYANCHNQKPSVVLYERAEKAIKCVQDLPLNHPNLRTPIQNIAKNLRIAIPPGEWELQFEVKTSDPTN